MLLNLRMYGIYANMQVIESLNNKLLEAKNALAKRKRQLRVAETATEMHVIGLDEIDALKPSLKNQVDSQ